MIPISILQDVIDRRFPRTRRAVREERIAVLELENAFRLAAIASPAPVTRIPIWRKLLRAWLVSTKRVVGLSLRWLGLLDACTSRCEEVCLKRLSHYRVSPEIGKDNEKH